MIFNLILRAAATGIVAALTFTACRPSNNSSISATDPGFLELSRNAGQLMIVGFRGPELTPQIRDTLRELHPGGICLYAQNISSAEQVGRLNDQLRSWLDEMLPPFIAVDQEGGIVVRIYDGVTVFPSMMAVGATRSPALAMAAGKTLGGELRLLGFNMNLAPVLDTPENPAIGSRAFSDDPRLIAQLGSAFIRGQQEAGMATVAKHFPGEGKSHGDSHYQLPVRWESAATIRAELTPFCEATRHELDAVMTAHVAVPSLAKNRSPATMSSRLLTGVLRQELDFDGLILTDEIEGMRAISAYGVERAAVAAVNAGADMVFVAFSPDIQKRVHGALMEAIQSGRISPERLKQALGRIVALKTKRKLFDALPPLEERLAVLRRREGTKFATEIAQQSITRFGPGVDFLPINAGRRIALITDSENFARAIRAKASQTEVVMIDKQAMQNKRATKEAIQKLAANSDTVIGAFILFEHLQILRSIELSKPLAIVFMNVPPRDLLAGITTPQAVLVNYCYQPVSAEATANALFQNPIMPGILPVNGVEPARPAAITANAQSKMVP